MFQYHYLGPDDYLAGTIQLKLRQQVCVTNIVMQIEGML